MTFFSCLILSIKRNNRENLLLKKMEKLSVLFGSREKFQALNSVHCTIEIYTVESIKNFKFLVVFGIGQARTVFKEVSS